MNSNKNRKILFVISGLGLGGEEKQLVDLINNFINKKFELHLIILGKNFDRLDNLSTKKVTVYKTYERNGIVKYFNRINQIYINCKNIKPDIIQGWGVIASTYATIAGLFSGVGNIFTGINFGMQPVKNTLQQKIQFNIVFPLILKTLYYFQKKIVVNSSSGKKLLIETYKIPRDKIVKITSGLDFNDMKNFNQNLLPIKEKLNIPNDYKLIGMVGKLDYNKDPMVFLKAALKVSKEKTKAKFLIIGAQGILLEEVRDYISSNNLNDIVYLINPNPNAKLMVKEFDICCLSSSSEGFPNVILEYMYWSKPCIVTDAGDSGYIVKDGVSGYVVPIGNYNKFSESVFTLLNDSKLSLDMGKKGRKRLEKKFHIKNYSKAFTNLYQSSLQK